MLRRIAITLCFSTIFFAACSAPAPTAVTTALALATPISTPTPQPQPTTTATATSTPEKSTPPPTATRPPEPSATPGPIEITEKGPPIPEGYTYQIAPQPKISFVNYPTRSYSDGIAILTVLQKVVLLPKGQKCFMSITTTQQTTPIITTGGLW